MGLLKTVFEVNLQLFQQQRGYLPATYPKFHITHRANSRTKERALLMFVLRDHIGTTPLSNLSDTLKKDLANIWSSLSKPPGLENCAIEDYFDFQFTALPHKILMPEDFNKGVDTLRNRYLPSRPDSPPRIVTLSLLGPIVASICVILMLQVCVERRSKLRLPPNIPQTHPRRRHPPLRKTMLGPNRREQRPRSPHPTSPPRPIPL